MMRFTAESITFKFGDTVIGPLKATEDPTFDFQRLSPFINASVTTPPTPINRKEELYARYPAGPLSLDNIEDALRRVSVRGFPMIKSYYGRVWGLLTDSVIISQTVETIVNDRDYSDRTIPLTFSDQRAWPWSVFTLDFLLREVVRSFLLIVVTHELDECTLVGGARVFDPHEGKRPGEL